MAQQKPQMCHSLINCELVLFLANVYQCLTQEGNGDLEVGFTDTRQNRGSSIFPLIPSSHTRTERVIVIVMAKAHGKCMVAFWDQN